MLIVLCDIHAREFISCLSVKRGVSLHRARRSIASLLSETSYKDICAPQLVQCRRELLRDYSKPIVVPLSLQSVQLDIVYMRIEPWSSFGFGDKAT